MKTFGEWLNEGGTPSINIPAKTMEEFQRIAIEQCKAKGLRPVAANGLPGYGIMGQNKKGFTDMLFRWERTKSVNELDVRDYFIVNNQWSNLKSKPCPRCLPNYKGPPPADGRGVARLCGQDQKTGQYLYTCSCGWEG